MTYICNGDKFKMVDPEGNEYRLTIEYDEYCENPRDWDGNIGTMVCWHRRYNLGDKHGYGDVEEFWQSLVKEYIEENELIDFVKNNKINLYLKYNEENLNWGLYDYIVDELDIKSCSKLLKDKLIILPLFLYDHSGITMNTEGFTCSWDSGQVGYIYATKDKFRKETGYAEDELFSNDKHRIPIIGNHVKIEGKDWGQIIAINNNKCTIDFDYNKVSWAKKSDNIITVNLDEIIEVMPNKAEEMLKGEVKTYDQFLTGDVYGFILEKKEKCECCGSVEWEEENSCWGFYGDTLENSGILDEVGNEFKLVV